MRKNFMVAALVCGAISWAQYYDESSIDNRVDGSVKEFIEYQKNNAQTKRISKKTDIAGRRGVSNGINYDVKLSDVQKMKVVLTEDPKPIEYEGIEKRIEFRGEDNTTYKINGKRVSESEFINKSSRHNRDYMDKVRQVTAPRVSNMTAQQIVDELNRNLNLKASVYPEVQSEGSSANDKFLLDYQIRNKSRITSNALQKGFKGQGVNIYFIECSRPSGNYESQGFFKWLGATNGPTCYTQKDHANNVLRLLHATAPEAMIYGGTDYPTKEQIEQYGIDIITHSVVNGKLKLYSTADQIADDIVYNSRIPYFAAVGNYGSTVTVGSPAKGFNVTAVAAVDPKTGTVTGYSDTKNGYFNNDKPELLNYTNFRYTNNETFDGTSAATPYTAAMAADLMSMHPSLKKDPALLKAVMLALSTGNASNPDYDVDKSQYFTAKIPFFPKEPMYAIFNSWDGSNSQFFGEKMTFKETNFKKGKRYRVAIAWLTSPTYLQKASNEKRYEIAQDYDLTIKQGSKIVEKSASYGNPFEVVDFTAPNSDEYVIEISRVKNLDKTEKRILGFCWYEVQ